MAEMYGTYTWRIENYSQINEKQLVSSTFQVGGYDWNILFYPQGCNANGFISLFLGVANHDNFPPGWSQVAQFSLSLVTNENANKTKRSDTMQCFDKKLHDWGWKMFVYDHTIDRFISDDTLVIQAQVQVIRIGSDQPFPCLDVKFRRELVRTYLRNVEGAYSRFMTEQRYELRKLVKDDAKWTSVCAFWLGMDQSSRRSMSQDKAEPILKAIDKHFFDGKNPISTVVLDYLYIGMKVLEEAHNRSVRMEKHAFALVDDVLPQLERAADIEPLFCESGMGVPDYSEDRTAWEEYHERRLTELGSQSVEIYVLTYISRKIEAAYQDSLQKGAQVA